MASVTCIAVVVGAGYGVLGVALFELLDPVAAPEHAVEAFTWLTTGRPPGLPPELLLLERSCMAAPRSRSASSGAVPSPPRQ
jgi:hypothetical protein